MIGKKVGKGPKIVFIFKKNSKCPLGVEVTKKKKPTGEAFPILKKKRLCRSVTTIL